MLANPPQYVGCTIGIEDQAAQYVTHLIDLRWLQAHPAQSRIGIENGGSNGLVDFVGNRGHQMPHGRHAVGVGQFSLHFAIASLAFTNLFFRLLAFGQVQHEGHPFLAVGLEHRQADDHRQAPAVLGEVLFLVRLCIAGAHRLGQVTLAQLAKLRCRQVAPAQQPRSEICAFVANHAQEGIVGFDDVAIGVPHQDADDVGVHQTADLAFALGHLPVQARVFQGNGGLGGHQFQHGDARRAEHPRRQVIFQVERTGQLRLVH
ncbi:hypothetical protein D3C73_835240 [compost metagenome]